MTDFDRAFDLIVGIEGDYSNDPDDPGGETRWGICKRDHPSVDIQSLTKDDAKVIYKRDYWDAVKCDNLIWPVNLFVFDGSVNQGIIPTVKNLQAALGITQDGVVGPVTLSKANAASTELLSLFMAERALDYTRLKTFEKYGRGWLKRLFVVSMSIGA